MTLIIGAISADGMVFCADREEPTEVVGKRSVSKLYDYHIGNWSMAIGTAGSGPISEVAVKKIVAASRKNPSKFANEHEEIVGKVLRGIYKQYVWPPVPAEKQQERGISLIIGLRHNSSGEARIYKTYDEILKPEVLYACAGIGMDTGYYFLDRLFEPELNWVESEALFAFVMKEAKESVGSVGLETDMLTMSGNGVHAQSVMTDRVINAPHLMHCMQPFWKRDFKA